MIWPVIVVLIVWVFFIRPLSYWKNRGVKQSKPWPILGDSWKILFGKARFLNYYKWIYEEGKGLRYYGFYEFQKPALAINDPELIKQITIKEFDSFTDHNGIFLDPEIDPDWGNNLLILRGQRWRHMRSMLSPNYTGKKMRINYQLTAETAERFINYFVARNQDIVEVEIKDAFSRFTIDVIAIAAFGINVDSLKDPNNEFFYHGKNLTNFQTFRGAAKFFMFQIPQIIWKIFGIRYLNRESVKFFHDVLFETLRKREEDNIVRTDLANILLESKKEREMNHDGNAAKSMSDEEVLAQALIFFFAGVETISSSLSWGAYELALNKDVQDKLRNEIRETYSKHGKPNFDVIQEMKYMDMVVSEILRKWPTFMTTDRRVTKPFTIEPADKNEVPVALKPETTVLIPIYYIQNDPMYFPNPEKFDPERFSEENKHKINPYTYIPFGAGPRLCIGNRFALLEIKCLLFNLLLNFEIIPTKKTPTSPKIVMPSFQYSMEGGYWLGLKRIKA